MTEFNNLQIPHLAPREKQILTMLAEGVLPKKVYGTLGITKRTYEFYKDKAYKKLGARSQSNAVAIAMELELIKVKIDIPNAQITDSL